MQKLDYLNLELPKTILKQHKLATFNISCNYLHGDHSLGSKDPSLNSLIDLIINLGRNLEYNLPKIQHNLLSQIEKTHTNIGTKLDFIQKHLESFDNKLNSFPSKREITDLIVLIESKPKIVEVEIKKNLDQFQETINSIKTIQKNLEIQVKDLKELVKRG
jgi:hypothetical protein